MNERPRNYLTLSQKAMVLLAMPLTVQIVLMILLAQLQWKTERDAAAAAKIRETTMLTSEVMSDQYRIVSYIIAGAYDNKNLDIEKLRSRYQKCRNIAARLRVLLVDEPEGRLKLDRSMEAMKNIADIAFELGTSSAPVTGEVRDWVIAKLRHQTEQLEAMDALAEHEKILANNFLPDPSAVKDQVRLIVTGGAIFSGFFVIIIGYLFRRGIVRRLDAMVDNSHRLARQLPLYPQMPEDDEIGKLDQAFHKMEKSLNQAMLEQRSLTENARDVICTLSRNDTFVSLNSASTTVFGYRPEELMGKKVIEFVQEMHPVRFRDKIVSIKTDARDSFETAFKRKDGRLIDLSWSARWSASDETMFCVVRDVTERKQAERMRQEVVQMVSHDLRSPLATIEGALNVLDAKYAEALGTDGTKIIAIAERNVSRMLTLINDLLEIERLEAGMLELHRSKFAISTVFDQVIESLLPNANEKDVRLLSEKNELNVYADFDRIIQVVTNLVSNAIKFSNPGGAVTLAVCKVNEDVSIAVADQGRGVPADQMDAIFDRFRQVRSIDAKDLRGSGLGLAICKALVELHGGSISVESVELEGSTFSFNLPERTSLS